MSEKTSPQVPTSAIIAQLVEVRDEKRRLRERTEELTDQWRTLEMELMRRLDEQGMLKASTKSATASVTEVIVPQVVDWDALHDHIKDTGQFYLLQKRPAAAAFREVNASGEVIPGMEPYTKRSISLRKI